MIIVETFEGARPARSPTDPDQDRHLMTIATLPAAQPRFSSPPAARRSRNATSSRPPKTLSSRCAHIRHSPSAPPKEPVELAPIADPVRDPKIPIGGA